MRQIMFKDTGPRLVFSSTGEIKMLRTGSDGFAEHNDASAQLALKLCSIPRAGATIADRFRITKPLLMQFVTLEVAEGAEPEAVLGANLPGGHWFTGTEKHGLDHSSVLSALQQFHDDVAAALAWGNFAIRVRGAENVAALAGFCAAIHTEDVIIAPIPSNSLDCHGIALVNLKLLAPEELEQLEANANKYLTASFRG